MPIVIVIMLAVGVVSLAVALLMNTWRSGIICAICGVMLISVSGLYMANNTISVNNEKGDYHYKVKIYDKIYYTNDIKQDSCGYYIDDYHKVVFRYFGNGDELRHYDKVILINRGDTIIDQTIDKDVSIELFCNR